MRRIQQNSRFSQVTISETHIYLTGQVAINNPSRKHQNTNCGGTQ